jgi:hypothetical protein
VKVLRHLVGLTAVLALCAPAAFILTFLLSPLWSKIEATYGIESIGHSGPGLVLRSDVLSYRHDGTASVLATCEAFRLIHLSATE